MPGGGAKPGERRGGRRRGGRNLLTIEREVIAEAVTRQAMADGRRREESLRHLERQAEIAADAVQKLREQGKPLAKDSLNLFLEIFMGRAAFYQPKMEKDREGNWVDKNENGNEGHFEKWARLSVDCAKALAPYQSPTYRAIMVAPPPPQMVEQVTKRFTLAVFDNSNGKALEAAAIAAVDEIAREPDDDAA